jgi:hypothetical protein
MIKYRLYQPSFESSSCCSGLYIKSRPILKAYSARVLAGIHHFHQVLNLDIQKFNAVLFHPFSKSIFGHETLVVLHECKKLCSLKPKNQDKDFSIKQAGKNCVLTSSSWLNGLVKLDIQPWNCERLTPL